MSALASGREDPEVGSPDREPCGPGDQIEGGRRRSTAGSRSRMRASIAARRISSQRSRSLFGRGSVGSETHPDAPRQELDEGHDVPGGQLGVALRAVGDRYVVALVEGEVPVGQPDAVGGEHPPIEHPPRRTAPPGPTLRAPPRRQLPPPRSRPGGCDQCIELLGRRPTTRRAPEVAPCRRRGERTPPHLDPSRPRRPGGRGRRRSGRYERFHRARRCPGAGGGRAPRRDHRSGAGRDGPRRSAGVLHEIGLAGRGHPEAKELGCGERHAPVDVARGQMGLPRPEHLLEPPVEGEVLARATEQGHRRVAVGADQPRGRNMPFHPVPRSPAQHPPPVRRPGGSDPGHDLP